MMLFLQKKKINLIVEAAVKQFTTELDAKLVAKPIVPLVIVLNKDITEAEPVTSIEGEVPVKTWLAVVNNEENVFNPEKLLLVVNIEWTGIEST